MRVRFEHPRKGTLEGIITFMLPAGKMFTHDQMLKYAGIDVDHPHYAGLRNSKRCDRYVMEYEPGAYMIMPKGVFTEIPATQIKTGIDVDVQVHPGTITGRAKAGQSKLQWAQGDPYVRPIGTVSKEQREEILKKHTQERGRCFRPDSNTMKCTCGVAAVGVGKHSSWCDGVGV